MKDTMSKPALRAAVRHRSAFRYTRDRTIGYVYTKLYRFLFPKSKKQPFRPAVVSFFTYRHPEDERIVDSWVQDGLGLSLQKAPAKKARDSTQETTPSKAKKLTPEVRSAAASDVANTVNALLPSQFFFRSPPASCALTPPRSPQSPAGPPQNPPFVVMPCESSYLIVISIPYAGHKSEAKLDYEDRRLYVAGTLTPLTKVSSTNMSISGGFTLPISLPADANLDGEISFSEDEKQIMITIPRRKKEQVILRTEKMALPVPLPADPPAEPEPRIAPPSPSSPPSSPLSSSSSSSPSSS